MFLGSRGERGMRARDRKGGLAGTQPDGSQGIKAFRQGEDSKQRCLLQEARANDPAAGSSWC